MQCKLYIEPFLADGKSFANSLMCYAIFIPTKQEKKHAALAESPHLAVQSKCVQLSSRKQ